MSPRKITRASTCEVCGRPTSRLLGVGAGITTHETSAASLRTGVLGYCAAHRGDVLPLFLARIAEQGTVEWVSEPPMTLRPGEIDDFLATLDATLTDGLNPAGSSPGASPGAELVDPHAPPQHCPHCGGPLSWGTGPHVPDAALRPGDRTWECHSCHAAGMLTTRH